MYREVCGSLCAPTGAFLKENKTAARFSFFEPIEFWERVDLVFKRYNDLALFWEAVVNSVVEPRATAAARTGRPDRVALGGRCVHVCVCVGGGIYGFLHGLQQQNGDCLKAALPLLPTTTLLPALGTKTSLFLTANLKMRLSPRLLRLT